MAAGVLHHEYDLALFLYYYFHIIKLISIKYATDNLGLPPGIVFEKLSKTQ